MSIIIKDEYTGRELEITLGVLPEDIEMQEQVTKGTIANYKGPLGLVFYRDGEEIDGTPITLTEFRDLEKDTREELTKIEGEARKLMERARELLTPVLRPIEIPFRVAAG